MFGVSPAPPFRQLRGGFWLVYADAVILAWHKSQFHAYFIIRVRRVTRTHAHPYTYASCHGHAHMVEPTCPGPAAFQYFMSIGSIAGIIKRSLKYYTRQQNKCIGL